MTNDQLNSRWTYLVHANGCTILDADDFVVGMVVATGLNVEEAIERMAARIVKDHNEAVDNHQKFTSRNIKLTDSDTYVWFDEAGLQGGECPDFETAEKELMAHAKTLEIST